MYFFLNAFNAVFHALYVNYRRRLRTGSGSLPCSADGRSQARPGRRAVTRPAYALANRTAPARESRSVGTCRKRCWKYNWVIDLDIRKFFDSVRWDLVIKAVEAHTDARWVVLYVKRWLAADLQLPDGTLQKRDRGTPQGSSVSPVLANLFMHYAFDTWLDKEFPSVAFERYADDAVIHCVTEWQARRVLAALHERMEQVGLELHPDKTKIVYCKDSNRRGSFEQLSFTFLGFTFQPRSARRKDGVQYTASPRGSSRASPSRSATTTGSDARCASTCRTGTARGCSRRWTPTGSPSRSCSSPTSVRRSASPRCPSRA